MTATDDLDGLNINKLRDRALPLMGWTWDDDAGWRGADGRRPERLPDPARNVADAMALVDAVQAAGLHTTRTASLEIQPANGNPERFVSLWDEDVPHGVERYVVASAPTLPRALTILALRAHARDR